MFYNYRLGMLTEDARYFDVMEAVLFNGLLSGVSLDGDTFFHQNPLESVGGAARRPDRRVPCCQGSICRTIPQVPGYMYEFRGGEVGEVVPSGHADDHVVVEVLARCVEQKAFLGWVRRRVLVSWPQGETAARLASRA